MALLRRSVLVAICLTVLVACSGGDKPSADAAGLFPATWHEPRSGVGALKVAAANDPGDLTFHVTVTTASSRAQIIVADCDRGEINVGMGGGGWGGRCKGHPSSVFIPCGGGKAKFDVSVHAPQRHRWGVAVYEASAAFKC